MMQPLVRMLLALSLSFSVIEGDDPITGVWVSVQRSRGELGGTKTYDREGNITATYGALVEFKYEISGNKIIMSFPGEPDLYLSFQLNGNKLTLIDDSGNSQELSRLSADAAFEIIGKWTGKHYTGAQQILQFTKSNDCYLSVPMISEDGSYLIKGNVLLERFNGKGEKEWEWSIEDSVLVLRDSSGKREMYSRRE